MAKRYTQAERRQHVEQWRRSGLSQKAYCKQNALVWTAFKNWTKRVGSAKEPTAFAPVEITPVTDHYWIIEAADGLRVHVPAHSDEKSLTKLINVLRSRHAP